jgi:hypothetical protein
MLLGANGANRKPFSYFDSGREHPNLFFQQAYAFTGKRSASRSSPQAYKILLATSNQKAALSGPPSN